MDRDIIFFIITMSSIIVINGLFFIINLAFVSTVTAVLIYYQKKMEKQLSKAITDTQNMLTAKTTHTKLIKMIASYMQGQTAAFMGNTGKNIKKWIADAGGDEATGKSIKGLFDGMAEAIGGDSKKKRKIKAIGKMVDGISKMSESKKKVEEVVNPPTPQITLTPEQEKKLAKAQEKILTKEQLEILNATTVKKDAA